MKQYLSPEQTAKLIELGFEKPNMALVKAESLYQSGTDLVWRTTNYEQNYSIGELIEMLSCLPMAMDISSECVVTNNLGRGYVIYTQSKELIDALFEQIVKLKEEGVV